MCPTVVCSVFFIINTKNSGMYTKPLEKKLESWLRLWWRRTKREKDSQLLRANLASMVSWYATVGEKKLQLSSWGPYQKSQKSFHPLSANTDGTTTYPSSLLVIFSACMIGESCSALVWHVQYSKSITASISEFCPRWFFSPLTSLWIGPVQLHPPANQRATSKSKLLKENLICLARQLLQNFLHW
jgi:hypothetical protein